MDEVDLKPTMKVKIINDNEFGVIYVENQGHNFWDTEIWMQPPILLMNPKWSEILLHYRFLKLDAAKSYSQSSGYNGAR